MNLSALGKPPPAGWDRIAASVAGACDRFLINTKARQEYFLATCGHESGGFTRFAENLNYSGEALWSLFKSHFASLEEAQTYARQPQRIANRIYASRMGNGDEASGDGWKFRGKSAIQQTGRKAQTDCSLFFFQDDRLVSDSSFEEWLIQPEGAFLGAGYYVQANHLNDLADAGNFLGYQALVNTGNKNKPASAVIGWADRQDWLIKVRAVL